MAGVDDDDHDPVLSVRFEVGVSLLLAPAGADKRGPKAPFPLMENAGIQPAFAREYPPELRQEPGLTESTDDHDDDYDDDVTCGLPDGVCQFPCLCIPSMDKMDIDLLCCLRKQILFRKSQQNHIFSFLENNNGHCFQILCA